MAVRGARSCQLGHLELAYSVGGPRFLFPATNAPTTPRLSLSLSALLRLLPDHFGAEVPWFHFQQLLLLLTFPAVQLHHVPTPSVVKGGRHSGPAVQVLPARASDDDPLAEERALGADFLVKVIQALGCIGMSL